MDVMKIMNYTGEQEHPFPWKIQPIPQIIHSPLKANKKALVSERPQGRTPSRIPSLVNQNEKGGVEGGWDQPI